MDIRVGDTILFNDDHITDRKEGSRTAVVTGIEVYEKFTIYRTDLHDDWNYPVYSDELIYWAAPEDATKTWLKQPTRVDAGPRSQS